MLTALICIEGTITQGEPDVNPRFLGVSNVVLTQHIGSAIARTRLAMAELAADNVIAVLGHGPHAGNPPNVVNRSRMPRAAGFQIVDDQDSGAKSGR